MIKNGNISSYNFGMIIPLVVIFIYFLSVFYSQNDRRDIISVRRIIADENVLLNELNNIQILVNRSIAKTSGPLPEKIIAPPGMVKMFLLILPATASGTIKHQNIHYKALIIYNRVGKCGSRTVLSVIKSDFHYRYPKKLMRFISEPMVSPGREVLILYTVVSSKLFSIFCQICKKQIQSRPINRYKKNVQKTVTF